MFHPYPGLFLSKVNVPREGNEEHVHGGGVEYPTQKVKSEEVIKVVYKKKFSWVQYSVCVCVMHNLCVERVWKSVLQTWESESTASQYKNHHSVNPQTRCGV